MSVKSRYFWGTFTIVAIAGGTIYAIKKSKDAKKSKESEITLEEAEAIMEQHKRYVSKENAEELEELIEDAKDEASHTSSFGVTYAGEDDSRSSKIVGVKASSLIIDDELDEEDEEDERSTLAEEDFRFIGEGNINPKEELELRHDPNSVEAKHQYIRMELADWSPLDAAYQVLLKLFDVPFVPENDGDEILRTQLIDFKVQFYGFGSRWVKDITIADVILHYARAAEYNCNESVKYWAEYFLSFNAFDNEMTDQELAEVIHELNKHTYFNEERQSFGLFGLTQQSMDQAIYIANRNVDRSVTYDIEFNEFLKTTL